MTDSLLLIWNYFGMEYLIIKILGMIFLPKNSLELEVKLKIKGRKDRWSPTQEKQVPFLEDPQPKDVFKIGKSDLIQDVIEHYRNFSFEALAHKD